MHFHGDLRSVVIQIIGQFDILIQVGRIIWEGIEAGMERAKRSIQWYLASPAATRRNTPDQPFFSRCNRQLPGKPVVDGGVSLSV